MIFGWYGFKIDTLNFYHQPCIKSSTIEYRDHPIPSSRMAGGFFLVTKHEPPTPGEVKDVLKDSSIK